MTTEAAPRGITAISFEGHTATVDRARQQALADFGEPVKHCPRCGQWLPADNEFFPRNGERLHSWCKACWSEYGSARRRAYVEPDLDEAALFAAYGVEP